jgi:hypothetical protein
MSDATTIGNFVDGTLVATDGSTLSATLALYDGAYSLDNLMPGGAEVEVYQSQGHVVGARKGARVLPTLSVNGHLTTPLDSFRSLVLGITSGFLSTTADIGDAAAVKLTFTATYGTSLRRYVLNDCRITAAGLTGGSPSAYALTFEVLGAVTLTDQTGTTRTLIAAR